MEKFPSWRYGPGGQSQIFNSEEEVPAGWVDHPHKVEEKAPKASPSPTKTAEPSKPAKQPATEPTKVDTNGDLDAHGHPYDASLHAATRSKTKDGLWRLKVGAKRPDPAPGYPKPATPLDL